MVEKKRFMSRSFLTITLVSLSFWLAASIYMPILPLLMRSYGYSMIEIGFISLAGSIGFAIFEPISGLFYDKIGMKKLLILGTLLGAITVFMFSLANQLWMFIIITFLRSAAGACISSPTRAAIAHTTTESQRGKSYGTYTAILSVGRIVGPPLGGFLAQTVNYTVPFYASTIVLAAGFLIALTMIKNDKPKIETDISEKSDTQKTPRLPLKTVISMSVILVLLLRILSMFIMNFTGIVLPVYAKENPKINAGEAEIGAIFSIGGVVSAILGVLLGSLIDRFGRKKLLITSTILIGFTFLSYLLIESILQIYLVHTIFSTGSSTLNLVLTVLLMDNVPSSHYGAAMGFFGLSEDIGGIISSISIGYIYDEAGANAVFYFLSIIMFLSTIIGLIFIKDKTVKPSKTIKVSEE